MGGWGSSKEAPLVSVGAWGPTPKEAPLLSVDTTQRARRRRLGSGAPLLKNKGLWGGGAHLKRPPKHGDVGPLS